MAVPLTPPTPSDRVLRQLEQERKIEEDGQVSAWAFLWTLFVFKIVTVGIIWYVAAGSGESIVMIAATTWYWLVIPALAISGPLIIRWKLIKMRRKREQLKASEWDAEPDVFVMHVPAEWDGEAPHEP